MAYASCVIVRVRDSGSCVTTLACVRMTYITADQSSMTPANSETAPVCRGSGSGLLGQVDQCGCEKDGEVVWVFEDDVVTSVD